MANPILNVGLDFFSYCLEKDGFWGWIYVFNNYIVLRKGLEGT